jgi:hypothetical protein
MGSVKTQGDFQPAGQTEVLNPGDILYDLTETSGQRAKQPAAALPGFLQTHHRP